MEVQLADHVRQQSYGMFWRGHSAGQKASGPAFTEAAEEAVDTAWKLGEHVEARVGQLVMRAYLLGSAWTFLAVVGIALLARGLRGGSW